MPQGKYTIASQQGEFKVKSPSEIVNSKTPDIVKKAANYVANIDPVTIASGTAGGVAGAASLEVPGFAPFSGIIGSGTMAAVDRILRGYTGEYQPNNPTEVLKDVTLDTAKNELVGKLADGILSKGNALYDVLKNSNTVKTGLERLKPTFSQLLRSEGSPHAKVAGWFEDLFAPTNKMKSLENSFNLAKDEGDKFIENLTGRKAITLEKSDQFSRLIKEGAEQQFLDLKNESNMRGEAAKLIAEANREIVPVFQTKVTGKVGTQNITSQVKVGDREVKGPIDPTNTILFAKKILDKMDAPLIGPDPLSPAKKALQDVLERSNAKFDKAGNLISYDKVSFGDMWETKKISDGIGYGNPMVDVTIKDTRFQGLSREIDKDIESSIPLWKTNGTKALQLYTDSKLIVAKRNALFNATDETGKSLDTLLNKVTEPKQSLNAIFDDVDKTQKFLNTGSIVIPEINGATATVTPIKYITSNARKDAQGYTLMRLLNESTTQDTLEPTKQVFDATKLMGLVSDPEKQEVLTKIFGSQGLSNVKQFFKNISFTTQKGSNVGASRYLGLKIGTYGVSLGAGIATFLTQGTASTSGILGGVGASVTFGAHQLAKLMTEPESARIMIKIAQGAPLDMSTQLATRVLANSLRNQPVTIEYQDGNKIDGKIDNRGKFTIPLN